MGEKVILVMKKLTLERLIKELNSCDFRVYLKMTQKYIFYPSRRDEYRKQPFDDITLAFFPGRYMQHVSIGKRTTFA